MTASLFLKFFIGACATLCCRSENITLELLHVLFRHGDRTPVNVYPNDPYKSPDKWPIGWGQLTNEGKRRHYRLGQFLRSRYAEFLDVAYKADEVYIRSTNVDRTLMSAESNLAGLYVPVGEQIWSQNLSWQPIPVHTVPIAEDFVLSLDAPCPRYDEMVAELESFPEIKKFNDDRKEMYDYVSKHSGMTIKNARDAEYIYDTLFIENRFNLTLPEWTNSVYPEPLRTASDFSFSLKAYTPEMKTIRGGPLVKEIREHFKSKVAGTMEPKSRRFFMYSAHDVTIAMFLQALNVFNGIQPPYASLVMVELHRDSENQRHVKILYKNHTLETRDLYTLVIPGCTPLCPIKDFLRLTQDVVIDDLASACKAGPAPSPLFPALSQTEFVAILVAGIMGLGFAITLIALLVTCGRLKRYDDRHKGYNTVPVDAD